MIHITNNRCKEITESRSEYHLLSLAGLQHVPSEVQTMEMYIWGPSIAVTVHAYVVAI